MVRKIKYRHDLFAGDRRIEGKKLGDRFAPFQEVDKALYRDTCVPEARRSAHPRRINPNGFVKGRLMLCRHNFRLRDTAHPRKLIGYDNLESEFVWEVRFATRTRIVRSRAVTARETLRQ